MSLKTRGPGELIAAVRRLAAPGVTDRLMAEALDVAEISVTTVRRRAGIPARGRLRPSRRARVLMLYVRDLGDAEIGRRLGIKKQTVRTYRLRMRLPSRTAAGARPRKGVYRTVTIDDAKRHIEGGAPFGDVFPYVPSELQEELKDWYCGRADLPVNRTRVPVRVGDPTGDPCKRCGGLMVRTGTCLTCQACGESSGGCG